MKKNYWNLFIVGTLISLMSCKQNNNNTVKDIRPNVILFVVDDLGWTDAGVYGSDLYQTPSIDKLAMDGVLFTNAYAATNVCSPTRASILTGKYPARLHITDWITGHKRNYAKMKIPDWTKYLPQKEYTMAELFKDNGYSTFHVGKWHLGEERKDWPEYHGFEKNIAGFRAGSPKAHGGGGYFSPYNNPRLKDGPDGEYLTERLADEVVNLIANNKNRPFFLNFWLYNVHTPLEASEKKVEKYDSLVKPDTRHNNATYAAMVEHMDDALGKVMKALKDNDLEENTILVFTSDNGGLRGNYENGKVKVTDNSPLRSGKGDNYEGGVRVPLIFKWPSRIAQGKTVDAMSISPDFYPTLMNLAQLEFSEGSKQEFDGIDLSNILTSADATETNRETIFWHYPHYHLEGASPYSAIRHKQWKLIHTYEDDAYQLYNLDWDIGEKQDISDTYPERVEDLKRRLQQWLNQVDAQLPSLNEGYDPKKEEEWTFSISATT